jgi:DNA replication and repair protein RecF
MVAEAYEQLAGTPVPVELVYEPEWRRTGLAAALAAARSHDLRRGASTVGPHRDDVVIGLDGMPARTHASQGEQRTLALALRLAAHRLVAERTDSTPVLVLDDVLSELDPERATALLSNLPPGQVIITSASPLPPAAKPSRVIEIEAGTVVVSSDDDA